MSAKTIKVIIKVLPSNEDVDVELPVNATPADIIEKMLESGIGPRNDNAGNPITYNLTPKGKNIVIGEDETLGAAQVQEGDVLLMTPVFVAGV